MTAASQPGAADNPQRPVDATHPAAATEADPWNLRRFLDAQAGVYETALDELHAGQKRSHWMWFIFPQIVGLGQSETSRYFAISGYDEAKAYLAHPVLGPRLTACCQAAAESGVEPETLLGFPDCLKLRSCATLFAAVAGRHSVFQLVLDRLYDGRPDPETLRRLTLRTETGI